VSSPHKALVRRFLEEIHNKGNLAAVEEFIHAAHVRHTNQTTGGGRDFHGPEGFREAVGAFRRAFSDIHFTEAGSAPTATPSSCAGRSGARTPGSSTGFPLREGE
jgi:hypothetical protein